MLPDSDLLKAIHSYSSHFYGASKRGQGQVDERDLDERSMDETALLAFGILLEEAGREVLGRRGDLVFTEAAEPSEVSSDDGRATGSSHRIVVGKQEVGSSVKSRKRRRIATPERPES